MVVTGLVKGAADLFLGQETESKVGMGVGAVLFALGAFDRDVERAKVLKVLGAGVLAFFFLRETEKRGTPAAAIEGAAALPPDNAGVSAIEQALGVFGRAVGLEPDASIEDRETRAADERTGPFLGTPKNVLRVAGAWLQPTDGGTVPVAAFSSTFQAFAVLENQSGQEVAGQVRARISHEGLLQSETQQTYFDGPHLRLAPGEMRELEMRLPTVRDADGRIELALLFSNFNLATIRAQRELVLS